MTDSLATAQLRGKSLQTVLYSTSLMEKIGKTIVQSQTRRFGKRIPNIIILDYVLNWFHIWPADWNTIFSKRSKRACFEGEQKDRNTKRLLGCQRRGMERQASIVPIGWLQSQGVCLWHMQCVWIGLNSVRQEHPRERRENPSNTHSARPSKRGG